jgi:hypothetical protein
MKALQPGNKQHYYINETDNCQKINIIWKWTFIMQWTCSTVLFADVRKPDTAVHNLPCIIGRRYVQHGDRIQCVVNLRWRSQRSLVANAQQLPKRRKPKLETVQNTVRPGLQGLVTMYWSQVSMWLAVAIQAFQFSPPRPRWFNYICECATSDLSNGSILILQAYVLSW